MGADREAFAHRQRALAEFGEFALRDDDLQDVLDGGCWIVASAIGADVARIFEFEADRKTALLRAGVCWRPDLVPTTHRAGGTS